MVEVAVLGRAVLGRPVPGVERGLETGRLCGYGVAFVLVAEIALAAVDSLRGPMVPKLGRCA